MTIPTPRFVVIRFVDDSPTRFAGFQAGVLDRHDGSVYVSDDVATANVALAQITDDPSGHGHDPHPITPDEYTVIG